MVLLVCAAAGLTFADWWAGAPAKVVDPKAAVDLMAVENSAAVPTAKFAVVPPIATAPEPTKHAASPAVSELFSSQLVEADVQVTSALPATESPDDAIVYFDGRPMRKARTIDMTVTAYSPDATSCGPFADGYTASGYSIWTNGMKLAAADTSVLPFGSVITVPGYNDDKPVPVLDRGGAIKGNRLDMLYPTHSVAMKWGRQKLQVVVWEYADE